MEGSFKDHLYVLIVCGGSGTRLWPRSRKKTPKQFLPKFYGEKTLFAQTVERANLLTQADKIFVITNSDYADEVLQQGEVILPKNIITEPIAKNTAMAVGVGAAYIKKTDPEAIIITLWSDAAIKETDLFTQSLLLAAEAASKGDYLVTVGLKPTFPHTGLGYIEAGEKLADIEGEVFKVNSFKEKPDLATAEEFVQKGNYYWNMGLLIWSAQAIFNAFSKHSPQIYSLLEKVHNAIGTSEEREVLQKAFEEVESTSIDYAVSEKADNMLLVPANFTWSDIGDWKVNYDLKAKDENGNVFEVFGEKGWWLGEDTKDCLIEVEDKLVATVGVSNLVIIQTEEAILVCAKDKAQDVKKIVNALKEKDKKEYL
jgi:mannose-1-phosphate guanylyltransferase